MPSAARRVRVRTYDPARTRDALRGQAQALVDAVHGLCERADAEQLLAAPTRLDGWRVRELVAHLGSAFDALTDRLGLPAADGPPLSPTDWVTATRTAAPAVADRARQRTGADAGQPDAGHDTGADAGQPFGGAPAEVAAALEAAVRRALRLLDGDHPAELRLPTRYGTMLLGDFLVTRLVEAVVHADDLADALARADPAGFGPADGFRHDRQALASVVRLLADTLAVQAPGGAVELRIPPFAVVQCVQGPRHTRGTPPNVVETTPLAWIRLASGRTSWARATGADGDVAQLTASGERSDLSSLLPVMG
ncbi:hypothetical protein GXW83_32525 [Streptacidiphilus sp. PB12-B1b]|uniref:sterol carrier family protein n=1 Tax=Streptacidiphilus sp. PB12-B1b TaxID=2705012 RepID=UPI0015F82BDB|nr:sterol carrier family protein [Streptacidiphilus sp. PB12-B1b]QMU79727.1 hypothetical protein GXW83_32525 [Streptacidiphilus sp. PB12-B1b]